MSEATVDPTKTDASERSRRHHALIMRRRITALVLVMLVVAAAVAVPLALRGSGADGSAAADGAAAVAETAGPATGGGAATTVGSIAVTPTSTPAASAVIPATATTLEAPSQPVTEEVAKALHANELGLVPVLMYHKIGPDIVAPQRLREDIGNLRQGGFYPTTIREMVDGTMDIPAGKSPVILTFDDSSPTHYKILEDGSLDPDCAVAIILAAVEFGDWAPKASFFPLIAVDSAANILFGQPEYAQEKLRNLVSWGFEVGSHSMTHRDLSTATPEQIRKELAQSKARLEEIIGGGYRVFTLNPPYGEYPEDVSLLTSGEYDGVTYEFSAVLLAAGGSSFSPFSSEFDPLHIRRITAYPPSTVCDLIFYFQKHPELRFVSDGDPGVVSAPEDVPAELGEPRAGVSQKVIRY